MVFSILSDWLFNGNVPSEDFDQARRELREKKPSALAYTKNPNYRTRDYGFESKL